ncbi:MAG: DeoR/GlpR family DNA-binding transcription regulator [Liquorilactobacillus ghanensis]|jgi:DeoR/GlpR family transcriptional regulator of sugar metabolism|uniref:DeoR family transcriptional regulator n=1 Tax=Liquorilactobacillus ghanensis DSM 18630 TaxID=1423750 RepID=A0A0R1VR50_9LACO|nr:DeoR/GlpR family DNA-binding transcription regulator [Liquorilactobacillus ghanensis]KRM07957.1 DeoR family transcriptional regulator [Liquorilactobacillus ghanensis DSM 18630]
MSQEKRIELIKQLLEERQELTTKDIMSEFGVSQDTARRDIVLLAERGEVKRTHGGILPLDFGNQVLNFQKRLSLFTKEKTRIALEAVNHFHAHHVYFIDASTILLKTCQNLNLPLTVITHSLDNCMALAEQSKVTVKALGGTFDHESRFFYSDEALQELDNVAFDTVFIAASGIDEHGIYILKQEDAKIVGRAVERARRVILVAEHQKFVNTSYFRICKPDRVSLFITDQPLTPAERAIFPKTTKIQVAGDEVIR